MISNGLRDERPFAISEDLVGIVVAEFPTLVFGEFLEDFHIGIVNVSKTFLVVFGFEDFVCLHKSLEDL